MRLQYLAELHGGQLYFQKRWPSRLLPLVRSKGKGVMYKKALKLNNKNNITEIAKALQSANDHFTAYTQILLQGNIEQLSNVEREKRALVYLDQINLKKGDLHTTHNHHNVDLFLDCNFEEMIEFDKIEFDKIVNDSPAPKKPELVRVQETAWRLLKEPPEQQSRLYTFTDAWTVYEEENKYEGTEKRLTRAWKKTQSSWDEFLSVVGEQVIDQQTIQTSLSTYYLYLKKKKKANGELLKPSSIARQMTPAKAAFREFVNCQSLPIAVISPMVKGANISVPRYTFNQKEQIELLSLSADTSHELYAPWKEIFILIAIQSASHASELQRMKATSLFLDYDIPVAIFDTKLKTASRHRIVPLVLKVERIRELQEIIQDGSSMLLGTSISEFDESRISHELSALCKQINPKASAYSLRHSFAYNADIAEVSDKNLSLLGGWSNDNKKISTDMMRYGKSGIGNDERLVALQKAAFKISEHLL